MLTEVGRVVAVETEALWVETIRRTTCGSCAAQKGCGHGLLNRVTDGKRSYIRVLPGAVATTACSVDDEVIISIPEEIILRGSLIAYVLPLVCMMTGAVGLAGIIPDQQDMAAALGALGGLAVGFGLVRWHGLTHRHDPGFQPVLLKVIQPTADPLQIV
jgi:sigma-E factor negative regulatory protein RseC